MDEIYLDQLRQVLEYGNKRSDRTGVGTISCFGLNARYNMADGFPAVTTKKLAWKVMSSELLWFVSGSTNIQDLKKDEQDVLSLKRRSKVVFAFLFIIPFLNRVFSPNEVSFLFGMSFS